MLNTLQCIETETQRAAASGGDGTNRAVDDKKKKCLIM